MIMYYGSIDSGMNNECAVKNGRMIFGMQSSSVRISPTVQTGSRINGPYIRDQFLNLLHRINEPT